jgi:hypothetical protein
LPIFAIAYSCSQAVRRVDAAGIEPTFPKGKSLLQYQFLLHVQTSLLQPTQERTPQRNARESNPPLV